MDSSNDTMQDFDLVNELRVLVADAIDPIDRRLAALEANIDLILQELRPVCQRLASIEQRQQVGTLTPVPRASSR